MSIFNWPIGSILGPKPITVNTGPDLSSFQFPTVGTGIGSGAGLAPDLSFPTIQNSPLIEGALGGNPVFVENGNGPLVMVGLAALAFAGYMVLKK